MSEDPPEDAIETIREFIEQNHGYLSWLGVTVEKYTFDSIVLTVPYDDKLTNPTAPPTMHGGVAATLIDTSGGLALRATLDDPIGGGVVTINLNTNYLQQAVGDLTARAEVVRAGNNVGMSRVTVESETPNAGVQPIAVGQGAYRLFQE